MAYPIALEHQSRILLSIVEPDNESYSFNDMHDYLYARGFTIYPGKLAGQQTFRLAILGALTLEDIRAERHAFDHGGGAPRPDQIPRIKNLGMMASQNNTYVWKGTTRIVEKYGIEYANWVIPRKSMTDAGVMTSAEIDRPMPDKVFLFIEKGMTRVSEEDGKVYGPRERTDRIIQL